MSWHASLPMASAAPISESATQTRLLCLDTLGKGVIPGR